MEKFKNWLRNKLTKFLLIDNIINLLDKHIDKNNGDYNYLHNLIFNTNDNTVQEFENHINDLKYDLYEIQKMKKEISRLQNTINVLHNTIENIVHIGTDIRCEGRGSWAVICIEGKMNIVKFVDLDRKDAREVMNFLKSFEAGRHCIDTPYKEMFYDGLFEF